MRHRFPGLFAAEYPECWKDLHTCTSGLVKSVTYTEIGGVIAGMVTMGYIADKFGRRNGSRITSLVMLIGCVLLTASYGSSPKNQLVMYTTALAIFGYGVGVRSFSSPRSHSCPHSDPQRKLFSFRCRCSTGLQGEYPLASASAVERSQEKHVATAVARSRGRDVVLTFSMQGGGKSRRQTWQPWRFNLEF
jgi:MFS family permease